MEKGNLMFIVKMFFPDNKNTIQKQKSSGNIPQKGDTK